MTDYMPNKMITFNSKAHNLLESVFPYDVVVVNPYDSPNDKSTELLLTELKCPTCGNKTHYNDLWNRQKEFKVTFIRTCHRCHKLFLLVGRYDELEYDYAFRFYDTCVYNKNRNTQ